MKIHELTKILASFYDEEEVYVAFVTPEGMHLEGIVEVYNNNGAPQLCTPDAHKHIEALTKIGYKVRFSDPKKGDRS